MDIPQAAEMLKKLKLTHILPQDALAILSTAVPAEPVAPNAVAGAMLIALLHECNPGALPEDLIERARTILDAVDVQQIDENDEAAVLGMLRGLLEPVAAPQATPPVPKHVPEATFGNIEAAPATEADMAVYDSIAAQYRRESVADQMAPIYAAFGESAPPAAPAPAPQPLTGDQVFASEDFMAANGLYWGLSLDTLMQIIRVTERAHGITGGATGGKQS